MFDRDIDPDEGRELPEPFFEIGQPCGNCGRPCESLVWVPGYEYFGCDDCAFECKILVYAEENCETLYHAILRTKSVAEVSRAYQEHKEECPNCNKTLRLPVRRQVNPEGPHGTGQPAKEAA